MNAHPSLLGSLYVDGAEISFEDNGHMLCDQDQTYWCVHIQKIVKDGLDVPHIWDLTQYDGVEWVAIEVPIIPAHNQWAPVRLAVTKVGGQPMIRAKMLGDSYEEVFLGFLAPGEGRMTLRAMVYDWFRGTVDPDSLNCQSKSHKFAAQMRWESDMKDEMKGPAQLWCVWRTGACLSCTYSADDDNSDLIPDAGTNPWSS